MINASTWRVTVIAVIAKLLAIFGRDVSGSNAGMRTNAKFIFACVMQLFTILVMLNRSVMNPCGSPTAVCSVGISFSSAVEVGIYKESGGWAGGVISECRHQESRGGGMYGFPLTLVPACWKRVACGNDNRTDTIYLVG